MSAGLEGRIAFVTGTTTGLGRCIARVFAEAGATGVGFDTMDDAGSLPEGWRFVRGDVADEAALAGAIETIRKEYGRLDVAVANAGVVPPWSETAAIDLDDWDRVFAVNVRGVVATIKHAALLMRDTGGSIVAMGSLNSRRAHPKQCAYTASKHAVLGIVRATALDLGRFGIRVNALGPGPIATAALRERVRRRAAGAGTSEDEALAGLAAQTALGRLASEDDVARAALFLASDLSAGISGQILPVDAGLA